MKKTLLSVLAAVSVVGAASAVPSAMDRQQMCANNPSKYVWVAKTSACVPINPCVSSNASIKEAYCDEKSLSRLPADSRAYGLVLQRYAKKVLNTDIVDLKDIEDNYNHYIAVTTSDGGYIVYPASLATLDKSMAMDNAIQAYGYSTIYSTTYHAGQDGSWHCGLVSSETECQDIVDFASLVFNDLVGEPVWGDGLDGTPACCVNTMD